MRAVISLLFLYQRAGCLLYICVDLYERVYEEISEEWTGVCDVYHVRYAVAFVQTSGTSEDVCTRGFIEPRGV